MGNKRKSIYANCKYKNMKLIYLDPRPRKLKLLLWTILSLFWSPGMLMSNCLSKTESNHLRMLAFFAIQNHRSGDWCLFWLGYGAALVERTRPLRDGDILWGETSIIQDTTDYYKDCFLQWHNQNEAGKHWLLEQRISQQVFPRLSGSSLQGLA